VVKKYSLYSPSPLKLENIFSCHRLPSQTQPSGFDEARKAGGGRRRAARAAPAYQQGTICYFCARVKREEER